MTVRPRMAIVPEVDHGPLDAVDALAHRHFRQTDQHGFGQTHGDIDLGHDRHRVDAYQSERVQLGQHGALLAHRGYGNTRSVYVVHHDRREGNMLAIFFLFFRCFRMIEECEKATIAAQFEGVM